MSKADEIIANSVDAIKAGDTARGCDLLVRALQVDPNNEVAWFWLSAVVATKEEQRYCLKRVLEINCDNCQAREGLDALEAGPIHRPLELVMFDAPALPEVIRLEPPSSAKLSLPVSGELLLKHPGLIIIIALVCMGLILMMF